MKGGIYIYTLCLSLSLSLSLSHTHKFTMTLDSCLISSCLDLPPTSSEVVLTLLHLSPYPTLSFPSFLDVTLN